MKRLAFSVLSVLLPTALLAQTDPVDLLNTLQAEAMTTQRDDAAPPETGSASAPAPTDTAAPSLTAPTLGTGDAIAPSSKATSPERPGSQAVSRPAPRILYDSDKTRYPFGYGRPSLRCVPLIACEIELQEGEVITGFAVGDSDRWILDKFESGAPDHRRQHVVVKPAEWGVGTNLLIGTDRRVYSLDLIAPARSRTEDKGFSYTHVAFYYPDELLARQTEEAARESARQGQTVGSLRFDDLHLDYRISGPKHLSWRPVRVFDDGQRTFIQFSPAVRSGDVPALLALSQDGRTGSVLNYRRSQDGLYYIVDGTFARARLLVQAGRKHSTAIDITREN